MKVMSGKVFTLKVSSGSQWEEQELKVGHKDVTI